MTVPTARRLIGRGLIVAMLAGAPLVAFAPRGHAADADPPAAPAVATTDHGTPTPTTVLPAGEVGFGWG